MRVEASLLRARDERPRDALARQSFVLGVFRHRPNGKDAVHTFDCPIESPTSSTEALRNYYMGLTTLRADRGAAGISMLNRAIELDPNFPMAYSALASAYSNLQQPSLALENATKAYDLRNRATERERLKIAALYFHTTGEVQSVRDTLETLVAEYPSDPTGHFNLGASCSYTAQWERAAAEFREVLRLSPSRGGAYSNLGIMYLYLNRLDDAQATFKQSLTRNLDGGALRHNMYLLAFFRGDEAQMNEQVAWASGKPGSEDLLLATHSDTETFHGRVSKARDLSNRAVASAVRAGRMEAAALWRASAGLREAELGNAGAARQDVAAALSLCQGRDVKALAALSLARIGDIARAKTLTEELERDYPRNTLLKCYWLSTVNATIELNRGKSDQAISCLDAARPYELGTVLNTYLYPIYVRGQAYLLAHNGMAAAAQFQKILDHRNTILNSLTGSLAYLQIGRAYAMTGETEKAKAAYQDFFTLWRDAEPEIPIYKRAKAEYAKLL